MIATLTHTDADIQTTSSPASFYPIMPTSPSSISMKEEFRGIQSKMPTPDLFMKYRLSPLSSNRRGNYFSLFLSDIISIVIINERQQPEFGKLLMVSIIQRADSPHVQLSLVTAWKCSGEIGMVDTEPEPCVCNSAIQNQHTQFQPFSSKRTGFSRRRGLKLGAGFSGKWCIYQILHIEWLSEN